MPETETVRDASFAHRLDEWRQYYGDEAYAKQAARLDDASVRMGVCLSGEQIRCAIRYAELLLKWNQSFNITAIRTLEGIVNKHFLDSLSIVSHVLGRRVIDLGSGAGFPGIPVALAKRHSEVVLLDAKAKKVEFLRHAVSTLGIANVRVVHERIQNMAPGANYDTVLVRALGSLAAIAELAMPIVSAGGRVIAMKGKYPAEEIAALNTPCLVTVEKVTVPYLEGERHAVVLTHPQSNNT